MNGMLMNHVKFAFGVVTIYSACLSGSWKYIGNLVVLTFKAFCH